MGGGPRSRLRPAPEILEGRALLAGVVGIYPLPTTIAEVGGIAAGPDGNLWFEVLTGQDRGEIGRITTAGTMTMFPVTGRVGTFGNITTGPDGALWFTAVADIGRITTAGVVTEFPTPATYGDLTGITAGPDGALWFIDSGNNEIGRITTAGVVTEFATPTPDSEPAGITSGPDGNLWFIEEMTNKVGRITPAGVITEFPTPTLFGEPYGITSGPDGNLWFTDQTSNNIGRITPAGVITEFPLTSYGAGAPVAITSGPDGNLWFTERSGNIGRITTAGVATVFPISAPVESQPFSITTGPDGDLWFTSSIAEGCYVGRFSPSPSTQTGLTAGPNPAVVGQPITLTATVTPSVYPPGGGVSFSIDGGPATVVPLALVGTQEQASLPVAPLAAGSHTVVASYGGAFGLDPSSATLALTVASPPTVLSVRRLGFHAEPTTIVLQFGAALAPGPAQDPGNYRIIGPGGRAVAIGSAAYSPLSDTVTLGLRGRLNLHLIDRLTVKGTGAGGLTGASGVLLDGADDGTPGSDFVADLDAADLVLGADVPGGPARLARLREVLSKIEAAQARQLARPPHSTTTHAESRAVHAAPKQVPGHHH